MALSKKALETLIDLVEIKMSCLEVVDREDAREMTNLQQCIAELQAFANADGRAPGELLVAMDQKSRRQGRRRAA